jgi:hypothetical protein
MSKETHSQDSVSDPRNEEDYDTWEYGTEPIPHDHTWNEKRAFTQEALESYKDAAKADDYFFGDYNPYEAYGDIPD